MSTPTVRTRLLLALLGVMLMLLALGALRFATAPAPRATETLRPAPTFFAPPPAP